MAMKPLASINSNELPLKKLAVTQAEQFPGIAQEKLSALIHRIQLLICYKPREMIRLLQFYHYLLQVKGKLEHAFTREQILLKSFHQAGTEFNSVDTFFFFPGNRMLLERTFYWLKEELAGFTIFFTISQKHQTPLKGCSLARYLFMNELEDFTRFLEDYKHQRMGALFPVLLPIGSARHPISRTPSCHWPSA
jgi:hypothetical protein